MRVTEQVDALETLAYNPYAYLVIPRVLAGDRDVPGRRRRSRWRWGCSRAGSPRPSCCRSRRASSCAGCGCSSCRSDIRFGLIKSASFGFVDHADRLLPGARHAGRRRGRGPQHHPHGGATARDDPGARRLLGRHAAARTVIEFLGVHKAFGANRVLEGLTLTVRDGETMVIDRLLGHRQERGPQARGGPARPPTRGTCWWTDRSWRRCRTNELDLVRAPDRLRVPVRGAVRLDDGRRERAGGAAPPWHRRPRDRRPGPAERLAWWTWRGTEDAMPAELSGGMRKRVGLARAIALRPKYLLYDEPTTGLDPVTAAVIDQLIVRTREALGVTSIVVTHDMRTAYTVATGSRCCTGARSARWGRWRRSGRPPIRWCGSSSRAGRPDGVDQDTAPWRGGRREARQRSSGRGGRAGRHRPRGGGLGVAQRGALRPQRQLRDVRVVSIGGLKVATRCCSRGAASGRIEAIRLTSETGSRPTSGSTPAVALPAEPVAVRGAHDCSATGPPDHACRAGPRRPRRAADAERGGEAGRLGLARGGPPRRRPAHRAGQPDRGATSRCCRTGCSTAFDSMPSSSSARASATFGAITNKLVQFTQSQDFTPQPDHRQRGHDLGAGGRRRPTTSASVWPGRLRHPRASSSACSDNAQRPAPTCSSRRPTCATSGRGAGQRGGLVHVLVAADSLLSAIQAGQGTLGRWPRYDALQRDDEYREGAPRPAAGHPEESAPLLQLLGLLDERGGDAEREVSAGGVVFRRGPDREVRFLLIRDSLPQLGLPQGPPRGGGDPRGGRPARGRGGRRGSTSCFSTGRSGSSTGTSASAAA